MQEKLVARRSTFVEGLYSGLVTSPFTASPDPGQAPGSPFPSRHGQQPESPDLMEAKLKLLVEAPAAVEDALASLLNHADPQVQVCNTHMNWCKFLRAIKTKDSFVIATQPSNWERILPCTVLPKCVVSSCNCQT